MIGCGSPARPPPGRSRYTVTLTAAWAWGSPSPSPSPSRHAAARNCHTGAITSCKVPPNHRNGGLRKAHAEPRPLDSVMLRRLAGQGRSPQCAITRRRHNHSADPAPRCWAAREGSAAGQSCTGPAAEAAEPCAEPPAIASPTIPSLFRAETPTRCISPFGHEGSAPLILADLCEPAPLLGRRYRSCFDPAVRLGRCWCTASPGSHRWAACRGCHPRWAHPSVALMSRSMGRSRW